MWRRFKYITSITKAAIYSRQKSTMSDPCTNSSQEAIARLREFGYAFNEGDYTNNYSLCHILSYPYVRAAGELRKIDAASGKPGDLPYEFR